MYHRISDSSTRANQADPLNQSTDSRNFTETLADLALREASSPGELSDRMGLCCSRPNTSDANVHSPSSFDLSTSSLSSSSSPSSPARPIRPLFDYRTADLPEANVNGICVGLAAEWLRNRHSSPSSRMRALRPGSENHASAATRQQRYEDLKAQLRSDRARGSHNLQAKITTLREAGLEPSGQQTRHRFSASSRNAQLVNEVTENGSIYLLSLRFAGGDAHTITTSTSNGMTTLFDPNYGEFTVRSGQIGDLFKSLAERYRNPNGLVISTVVTQKIA
ncbi:MULTISPECIES: YopT-type cysteine protease domain-containing protein [unclassified Bradyrhizobium]|uniref:YopT-type cysteine protease domain-containing protein n=1 Tax=unclassified Bradyrhizobium TaxID=2631580 RepID=UPI00247A8D2A|nr:MULTISPECIES: YopT-type cysteine protease domain-containing protein [unclassified Bradyrhizobium]WGS19346.1 YopT-type cysteine protease domain-containing protein [Bradyrhizobium sp. ISRA463]WGS26182.1 YopT-type cysteine protease domain-containing protein [Bradyrhizobium sp. ISRA464]